jgi:hypothetical protein
MPEHQDQIGVLREEVARLQKSAKAHRMALFGLCCLAVGYSLMGMSQGSKEATFDTITCKGLTIVDHGGKPRLIAATAAADGSAGIMLLDSSGRNRIEARTANDGVAGIQLRDEEGKPRISALTDSGKSGTVAFFDTTEQKRILMGTTATAGGLIGLLGKNEAKGVLIAVDGNDTSSASLYDKDGKRRMSASASPNMTKLEVADGKGATRLMAGVLAENALLGLLDKDGKTRLSGAVLGNGEIVYPVPDRK